MNSNQDEEKDAISTYKFIISLGIPLIIVGVIVLSFLGRIEVKASERVVWQTFSGIENYTSGEGAYFYNKSSRTPHVYHLEATAFVIDDTWQNDANTTMTIEETQFFQPDMDSLELPLGNLVVAEGGVSVPVITKLSCIIMYHLEDNDRKLIKLHKRKTMSFRSTFMKPIITKILSDSVTHYDRADGQVSGALIEKYNNSIEAKLKAEPNFEEFGIVVDAFYIRALKNIPTNY